MRGMVSVVDIVSVPPGLCIVSHGVEFLDVVIFSMGQSCFNIFVVLYLLLGCFQCVLVSKRHAISAACQNILLPISSRVKAPLDNSIPPTFWYITRKVSCDFFVFRYQSLSSELCMGCHFFCLDWECCL